MRALIHLRHLSSCLRHCTRFAARGNEENRSSRLQRIAAYTGRSLPCIYQSKRQRKPCMENVFQGKPARFAALLLSVLAVLVLSIGAPISAARVGTGSVHVVVTVSGGSANP